MAVIPSRRDDCHFNNLSLEFPPITPPEADRKDR